MGVALHDSWAGNWSAAMNTDPSDYYYSYYNVPWFRAPPYLLGGLLGVLWQSHATLLLRWMQPAPVRFGMTIVAAGLLLATTYGLSPEMSTAPSTLTRAESAFYIAFAKPAWSLAICILSLLCFTRKAGLVGWVLERPLLGYVSKLTFAMYLIHPMILVLIWAADVSSRHFSYINYSILFIAALIVTLACALPVHLLIELPTANIEALLFRPGVPPTKVSLPSDDVEAQALALQIAPKRKEDLKQPLMDSGADGVPEPWAAEHPMPA